MPRMQIPVIGIGAGPATDGQVLVFHDLLGIYDGHAARFVKRYAERARRDDRAASRRSPTTCARAATPSPSTATRWRRTSSSACRRWSSRAPASPSRAASPSERVSVYSGQLRFTTEGNGDVIDLTEGVASVRRVVARARSASRPCSCPGRPPRSPRWSTSRAGCEDLRAALERLIPAEGDYAPQPSSTTTRTRTPTSAPRSSGRRRRSRSATAAGARHLAADRARGLRRPAATAHRCRAGSGLSSANPLGSPRVRAYAPPLPKGEFQCFVDSCRRPPWSWRSPHS